MKYNMSKIIDATFEQAVDRVVEALGDHGFDILSEINMHEKVKEKLDVNIKRYRILGACITKLAYKAMQMDDKIGVILPCNIMIHEIKKNTIEVTANDPVTSMMSAENPELDKIAKEIKRKLERVIESLHSGVESYGLV